MGYDKYYKKGGTYEIPTEIFNDLLDELSQLKQEKKELIEWLKEEIDKLENEKKEIKLSKGLDYSFALDDSINIYKKFLSKLKESDGNE